MARALIAANGDWPFSFNLQEKRVDYDTIIALDGAANRLMTFDILPDVVVGDLDSIDASVLQHCRTNGATIVHSPDQNRSDVSKGLEWVHQNHPQAQVDIVGVEIGRYDHYLAALSALFEVQSSARICMNGWSAQRVQPIETNVHVTPGSIVSLIPFGAVSGVTLEGCQYPLSNEVMTSGTRGISNKAIESTITVSAQSGDLLLLFES